MMSNQSAGPWAIFLGSSPKFQEDKTHRLFGNQLFSSANWPAGKAMNIYPVTVTVTVSWLVLKQTIRQ